MEQNYGNRFQNWEAGQVKKWIREFREEQEQKGRESLKGQNINDLAQDCLKRIYAAQRRYRCNLGRKARKKITERNLLNIVGRVSTEKKHSAKPQDPLAFMDWITVRDRDPEDLSERYGLKIDVEEALQKFTPIQRELCELLKQGLSLSAAGKKLEEEKKIKHRIYVYRIARPIRKIFKEKGLGKYSKN